jgi:hypothetical protein
MRVINATIACAALFAAFPAAAQDYSPTAEWERKAIEIVRAEDQDVVDARWSQAGTLWALMVDDGSPRDGYAETICVQIMQAGAPKTLVFVHILDAAAAMNGEFTRIGYHECEISGEPPTKVDFGQ